ncbi:hypothetical protein HC752_21910 [Vibrio sp. S9_S30]|uniref:hypothetical protein n=1 Tax=Vibrio sp. S9_S30 TaxID=2720226 RepID=UPI001681908F|nr:hypothetical protein [Vibrio sp. S9_S30]MBD1559603.1 hypothetical protein [Vibrio sp. S9_S30]
MMQMTLDVSDAKYFDIVFVRKCADEALKHTKKWLMRESLRRLGYELRIRSTAGRRRVKASKVKGGKTSVWYGIQPINLAYARDYETVSGGVLSGGERFYKGAFVQSINNSPLLIWRRLRERPKRGGKRRKPLPKGQRRPRKSPQPVVVREDINGEASDVVAKLELEIQDVFKEYFLNELHQQSG